jgi:hypothetical protein
MWFLVDFLVDISPDILNQKTLLHNPLYNAMVPIEPLDKRLKHVLLGAA